MMLAGVAALICGAVSAALGAFVWSRRTGRAGTALAALLAVIAVWNLAYGAELLATDAQVRLRIGDVKYAAIGALTPAWLSFILCWTGREHRVRPPLLAALGVAPAAVLLLLAVPATHDLVRSLPVGAADPLTAEIATGPAFWAFLAYNNVLLLPATALFVASLVRSSRAYWLQGAVLVAAALLPWAANLAFVLSLGPFGAVDLTPLLFAATGAVLACGLFEQRLLRLDPLARSMLVDRMTDGIVVLDAYGRVSDVNPAARAVLGRPDARLVGAAAADVLPPGLLAVDGTRPVVLDQREHEVTCVALPGRHRPAGRLLVLRDVHERALLERRLRDLLADRASVAEQLSVSLRPAALPQVPGLQLAARFRAAGGEREVGGDFYDVFAIGDEWAFTLGDVSGKGPRAAATAAHARYSLRTLAVAGARPAAALAQLHAQVVAALDDETFLTVVHGRLRVEAHGVRVVFALGGHPMPMLVRACVRGDGVVRPVGVPGTAIGLFEHVEVQEQELLLEAGDVLFLFTDGVSEARDGVGLFGEAGLSAALARTVGTADQLAERLLQQVLALHGASPTDDVAMLVVQAGPAVPLAPAPRSGASAVRTP